jgi:threonine/homoserine/homoserine lactone efflux protein
MDTAAASRSDRVVLWLFVTVHTLLPGALLAYLAADTFAAEGAQALAALAGTLLGGVLTLTLSALPLLALVGLLVMALTPASR